MVIDIWFENGCLENLENFTGKRTTKANIISGEFAGLDFSFYRKRMLPQKFRFSKISRTTIFHNNSAATEAFPQRPYKKVFGQYAANLQENTHVEVTKDLHWNEASDGWVFFCKFAAYFQNTFLE